MILAQFQTVSAEHIKDAILVLAGFAGLILLFKQITKGDRPDKREITPQPLLVKPVSDYMTRENCFRVQAQTEERIDQVQAAIQEIRQEFREVRKDTAIANEHRSEELRRIVSELEGKIQQVPHQMMALLRNAGFGK